MCTQNDSLRNIYRVELHTNCVYFLIGNRHAVMIVAVLRAVSALVCMNDNARHAVRVIEMQNAT